MAKFTAFQLKELNNIFNESGYTPLIANSNSEFSSFFSQFGINIYEEYGAGSKGRTLNNFFEKAPNELALLVIKSLKEIIDYEFSDDLIKLNKYSTLFKSIESTLSNEFSIENNIFFTSKMYKIESELAPGGFGDTYLVRDTGLNRQFVLKRFRGEFIKEDDNKKFLAKFLDEISILYNLNHANVVRIFDYSNKAEAWYIMEYIDGGNIAEYTKAHPNDLEKLFLQAINVFSFLETKNICHRDIRENNVLVNKEGILKIIDFGFGKIIEGNGTLKDATRMVNYPFVLPKELNSDVPKYTKCTEIYFVGKLFEKLINDNNIDDFIYKYIIDKMILEDSQERIDSFLKIKNIIREMSIQYKIIPKNLKQNFQDLISLLDNIIISKKDISVPYNYEEILHNLEELLENNILNEKLENSKFFADCFMNNIAEYYPKRREISIKYIDDLLKWLKSLEKTQKDHLIKNLHFKLNNYALFQDLPF